MRSESHRAFPIVAILIATILLAAIAAPAKAQTIPPEATRVGPVYGGRASGVQSYLRVFNSSSKTEAVTVNILADDGVRVLASWSGAVEPYASHQIAVADIEAAATPHLQAAELATQYMVSVAADGPGFLQHIVWRAGDCLLAVISGCGARTVSATHFAVNVHTDLIAGSPITLTVLNSSAQDQTAVFDVYNGATGVRVAGYSTAVRAGSSTIFTQAQFARSVGFTPRTEFQLNFVLAADFPGSVSHSVTTQITGVTQGLFEMCTLPWTSRDSLAAPVLPAISYVYADADVNLPAYYTQANAPASAADTDNTPASNAITNAGATLGRVLFYDKRLSLSNAVACASCHQQARGFGDGRRLSPGFAGGLTTRHSMRLTKARFYAHGRFFWDERAATREDQVLQPIQNAVECA